MRCYLSVVVFVLLTTCVRNLLCLFYAIVKVLVRLVYFNSSEYYSAASQHHHLVLKVERYIRGNFSKGGELY